MKFLTISTVLAICGLATAGQLYHRQQHYQSEKEHHPHHHIGPATSYASITKHVPLKHGWKKNYGKHLSGGYNWPSASVAHNYDYGWNKHNSFAGNHAKYEFDYGVKDLKTGDVKNHWEHRNGYSVKGSYSLLEADGTTRIVEYTADAKNGFQAVVKNIGHPHKPEVHKPEVQSKPQYSSWKDNNAHYGYNNDYKHGQATSYIYVKHY